MVLGNLELHHLKRVVFRAETSGKVKDLAGFLKPHHSVPDYHSQAAQKFIAKLAIDDIKADIDDTFQALREVFGLKRKEIEVGTDPDDGTGTIRTSHFDYTIAVRLDLADPESVIWRREVSRIAEPEIIQGPRFAAAFGTIFDRIVFEYDTPVNVPELVDRIEEQDMKGVKVRCASDASFAEITLEGFQGAVRIDGRSLEVQGRRSLAAESLLEHFFTFLGQFPPGR